MSKPLSTLPNPVESDANLTSALAQIGAEVDNQPLRSSALARIMGFAPARGSVRTHACSARPSGGAGEGDPLDRWVARW